MALRDLPKAPLGVPCGTSRKGEARKGAQERAEGVRGEVRPFRGAADNLLQAFDNAPEDDCGEKDRYPAPGPDECERQNEERECDAVEQRPIAPDRTLPELPRGQATDNDGDSDNDGDRQGDPGVTTHGGPSRQAL